jgi:serine/threonine protein kinase
VTAPPTTVAAGAPSIRHDDDHGGVLDDYQVLGVLGEGGMGRVELVRHTGWGLDLAVKTPKRSSVGDTFDQFVREAETWIGLGLHPHVVTCYFVRVIAGIPRVFAEVVTGGTLAQWIEDGRLYLGAESLPTIVDIAIQIAWGLVHAHHFGMVHQDIKPANVMMSHDGTAKVTDFGLARASTGAGGATYAGGTPAYWSPEQALSAARTDKLDITHKADVYSLGVVMLEMILHERQWAYGQVAVEVFEERRSDIPPALHGLLGRCLAQEPSERPSSADVVAMLRDVYATIAGREHSRAEPSSEQLTASNANNSGVALMELSRIDDAMRSFDIALTEDPLHPQARLNAALVEYRLGRIDLAEVDRRVGPMFSALAEADSARFKGDLYFELGFQRRAAESYARCSNELDEEELVWRSAVAHALGLDAQSALAVIANAPAHVRARPRIQRLQADLAHETGGLRFEGIEGVFDGAPLAVLATHTQAIASLIVQDGRVAWRGRDGVTGVADVVVALKDAPQPKTPKHPNPSARAFAMFDNGDCVEGFDDGSVVVVTESGIRRHLPKADGPIHSLLAFDDSIIVGAATGAITAWTRDAERFFAYRGSHRGAVDALAAIPDRPSFVSGGADGRVMLWGLPRRRRPRLHIARPVDTVTHSTRRHEVNELLGRAAELAEAGALRDAHDAVRRVQSIAGYERAPRASRLLFGLANRASRGVTLGALRRVFVRQRLHDLDNSIVSVHCDGEEARVAAVDARGNVAIWADVDGRESVRLDYAKDLSRSLTSLLVEPARGQAPRAFTSTQLASLGFIRGVAAIVCVSTRGELIVVGDDGPTAAHVAQPKLDAALHFAVTGRTLIPYRVLRGPSAQPVVASSIAPNGDVLLFEHTVRVGTPSVSLHASWIPMDARSTSHVSGAGRLAASFESVEFSWQGPREHTRDDNGGEAASIAVSNDMRRCVGAYSSCIVVFDEVATTIRFVSCDRARSAAWTAATETVWTSDSHGLIGVDVRTNRQRRFARAGEPLAVSPDGRLLVIASETIVSVLDTATGTVSPATTLRGRARRATFSMSGRWIVVGDESGEVHVLEIDRDLEWDTK